MPCRLLDNYCFLRKGQAVQKEYTVVQKTLLDLLDPGHEGTSLGRNLGNLQGNLKSLGLPILWQILEASSLTKSSSTVLLVKDLSHRVCQFK